VETGNGVSLDFADDHGPVSPQHYAFLVSDPGKRLPGQFNTNDGGRGVYWEDPSGHVLEIITRPYGSSS
jgi:hypothetical protein